MAQDITEANSTEPSSAPEQNGEKPERRFGIRFRFKPANIAAAAAVLAASILFFCLSGHLILEDPPTGLLPFLMRDVALYGVLTLAAAAICLLEIRLPGLMKRCIGWVFLLILPALAFIAVDCMNNTRIWSFPFLRSLANYLCYFMVFALLYALTRRVTATAAIGGAIFLIYGAANYFTVSFRGSPVLPWDLTTMGTAMDVMGGYNFVTTQAMAVSLLVYFLVLALSAKLCPGREPKLSLRQNLIERGSALLVSIVLFILLFPVNIMTQMKIEVWPWNQKTSSEITGITAGFYANVQFLMVEKPEGYSTGKVAELKAEIEEMENPELLGEPDKKPTIVAVMNESFTDMEAASEGRITLEPDNLPFLHSLQDSGDVIWGTAYSSVFGGNTCNSEYEFLSGNSLSFLPTGSKPYQQYVDHEQTSLVSTLKDYGYDCIAIHPGQASAWQRDTAYPQFGFDEFISVYDFDVQRTFEHGITSDKSSYDQVIYEYEHHDSDNPLFLFNVTIQNHGGFEDENFRTTIRVAEAAGEYPQTEQYLSLLKKSDESTEYLVDYFSKQDDPVVMIFFGDHWPNLENGFVSSVLGANLDSLTFEDTMRQYQVPFFIWANYPLKAQEIETISLNYLSGLLLRSAGLECTDYNKFVESVRQTFPVLTDVGMYDKDGNLYKNGDETPYDSLLNDYAILQYNNAFGKEQKDNGLFTIQK